MSTPRKRRIEEGVNALLASLFVLTLGVLSGFIIGSGMTTGRYQAQVDAGYLSMGGKPYRVQPMNLESPFN